MLAAVAASSLAACGSSHTSAPSLQVVSGAALRPGQAALVRPLPQHWAISFEVRFAGPRNALKVGLGSSTVTIFDGGRGWHHARVTERVLMVDGRSSPLTATGASKVSLRATGGPAQIRRLRIAGH